jgi:hypothetical protein
MTNVRYEVEIYTVETGNLLTIYDPISLEYARTQNQVGNLSITFPDDLIPLQISQELRIKVFRDAYNTGMRLAGDTIWFPSSIVRNYSDGTWTIHAQDALSLLARRIVAYTSDTPYADKILTEIGLEGDYIYDLDIYDLYFGDASRIDNMMRQYVRENFGALQASEPERDVSDVVQVEEDRSLAPFGEKEASFQIVLQTLQDLANQSKEDGTPLFFDMVPLPDNTFTFRVWSNYRGADLSDTLQGVTFNPDYGNIAEAELTWDYEEIGNVVYVLGEGTGISRLHIPIKSSGLMGGGGIRRREFTLSDDIIDEDSPYQSMALEALGGKRPKVKFSGRVVDSPDGLLFGRDYNFGDKVTVAVDGYQITCFVQAFRIAYSDGGEDLDIRLQGELLI